MDKQAWSKPVTFETDMARFRTIANTKEASRYLLGNWPGPRGPLYVQAQRVCLGVLAGRGTPDDAREAFVEALMESEIFVWQ
jgi:Protein of unknown function (DUF982)